MKSKACAYVRLCGNQIGNDNYGIIFQELIDAGYLVANEGYHTGYRVVDLEKLINDTKDSIVIDDTPRVHNNIVTLGLILNIQKWISDVCCKKKAVF